MERTESPNMRLHPGDWFSHDSGLAAPNLSMTMELSEPEGQETLSPSVDGPPSWNRAWHGLLPRDGNPYGLLWAHGQRAVHGADNRGWCRRCLTPMTRVPGAQAALRTAQSPTEWLGRVASVVRLA